MADVSRERIRELVGTILGVDPAHVVPDALFYEDFGADSLDVLELVMGLEVTLEFDVTDEEIEQVRSVRHLYALVASRLNVSD